MKHRCKLNCFEKTKARWLFYFITHNGILYGVVVRYELCTIQSVVLSAD